MDENSLENTMKNKTRKQAVYHVELVLNIPLSKVIAAVIGTTKEDDDPSARRCGTVTLGCLSWTDKEAMAAATVGCCLSFFLA